MKKIYRREPPRLLPLAEVVKTRRLELAITQVQLAERAKVNRLYITGIEAGRRSPTILVLGRVAVALELKFSEFIRRYELCSQELLETASVEHKAN